MRKTHIQIIWCLCTVLAACSSDDGSEGMDENGYFFEDSFETSGNDLNELFPQDGSRWTNIQLVHPEGGTNELELNSEVVLEGASSLRFFSKKGDAILSKVDIEKGGFMAEEGSMIAIEGNFLISTEGDIENLVLVDLECCSCWDPTVPDNQCPGVRLMMKGGDYLSIERGKIVQSSIIQSSQPFPRGEWVNVRWEMELSADDDGMNRLFINGTEVITETAMNMPNADVFREEFQRHDIDFELEQPIFYERFQIGATANSSPSDIEMYLDDVTLEITPKM